MLMNLLLGCATVFVSMGLQVVVVVMTLRYLLKILNSGTRENSGFGFGFDTYIISVVLLMLFVGHLFQVAVWALLFILLGEFGDFLTAFYHSTVNFASLGYGDIVMSEKWRLLGALEASNGVLMFGLSAGTLLAVMTRLFARHRPQEITPQTKTDH